MISLTRAKENPILTPSDLPWENMLVFNPGAIVHKKQIYLLYRAQGKDDPFSRLGIAKSTDGIHFTRSQDPLYYGGSHTSDSLGIEDARVVKIGDTYFITYTAVSENKGANINPLWNQQIAKKAQIALSTTQDFKNFLNYDVIIPESEGKNASLFPKKSNTGEFWLLYRIGGGQTFFANSPKLSYWPETYPLFDKRPGFWDSVRVGIGAPPIETEKGWLLIYHGIDEKNIYRLGVIFLDLYDPRKILYRSPFPIFEPQADYEKYGYVPNVVFTCGVIEKDDMYYVYYGGADEVIGLATIKKREILGLL